MSDKLTVPIAAAPTVVASAFAGLQAELLLGGFLGASAVAVLAARKADLSIRGLIFAACMFLISVLLAGFIGELPAAWLIQQDWWPASDAAAHKLCGLIIGISAQGLIEFVQAFPVALKDSTSAFLGRFFPKGDKS